MACPTSHHTVNKFVRGSVSAVKWSMMQVHNHHQQHVAHHFLISSYKEGLSKIYELNSDIKRDWNEIVEEQEKHETVKKIEEE